MSKAASEIRTEASAPTTQDAKILLLERGRPEQSEQPAEAKAAPQAREARSDAGAAETGAPVKKRSKARILLPIVLVALLGAGAWYGHDWWVNGRFIESTDDAYIQADIAPLGTKIAGYIASSPVKDGDEVMVGDIVATLDQTDYKLALDAALAKRATAEASIERIGRQITLQEAQIKAAEASISAAQADVTRTQASFRRTETLSRQSYSSKADLDQVTADRDRAAASLLNARANLDAAKANLDVIKAQKVEAEQSAKELDTSIAKARSDLEATIIRAPRAGIIGNRAIQPGQYVAPGTRLMALVPLDSVYIAANFKETQLASIRPGEKVKIEVDSLDGHQVEGTVTNISAASGSTYSLLPPDNATGNFTKITQRVTVRVDVDPAAVKEHVLRPGLSTIVSIDTRTGPAH